MSGETSHQEHIGPYRLLSRLGGGDVHRAAGPDGRDVAIRLLPAGVRPDVDRMRAVLSPYAVDVLDGGPGHVVSRFVPGRPLPEAVAEGGPMGGDELRRMALGLAKALVAIHRAGLAHGALVPDSVLVVDGAPVVVDFGLVPDADPLDDIPGWAATVTFAATGRLGVPAADALADGSLPDGLRPLVAAALHPDPAARPSAAELAEAAARLELPAAPAARPAARTARPAPPPRPEPAPAPPASTGMPDFAAAHELAVAQGWARLLAALVVVVAVGVTVMMPVTGLVLSLAAVAGLRLAAAPGPRGWPGALGRTLVTVPYAAAVTVAVPAVLAAVSAVGGEIDSLMACAFGAGAGAAVLWAAPGVRGPRRRLEAAFLAVARVPRRIAAAVAVLGVLALLAVVGAMSLTPSFAPMYGLQSTLENSVDRLQAAFTRL
ncbi:hypothetical protein [Spirillospora albida]|uniref:hypothetical protein n=1 Tax=Spirillospora albida TaxID=58123 RepID=UPI000564CEEB|nr:hypothetical protein [Spirillospora albida]